MPMDMSQLRRVQDCCNVLSSQLLHTIIITLIAFTLSLLYYVNRKKKQ